MNLSEQRRYVRQLLDDTSPKDAPTAYYALFHDPKRSALFTYVNQQGGVQGFVGRFQTGQDLFRPLVTLNCRSTEVSRYLLHQALAPGRPYLLFANLNQLAVVSDELRLENQHILQIYHLDTTRFRSQINVLIVRKRDPNGAPRVEIGSENGRAVAGINWQSPGFAEIYVQADAAAQQRGWEKSVVMALADQLIREGRRPIYLVDAKNDTTRQLAESIGFADTGYRQVFADAMLMAD